MDKINEYKEKGKNGWKLGNPCSGFAREAWQEGTGENLNANWWFISNPTTLKNSIINANGGVSNIVANGINGGGSASFGSSGRFYGSSINSSVSSF